MQNFILCQNKKVPVSEKYIIKKNDIFGELLYTEICPYVDSKNSECQQCYGKIAVVKFEGKIAKSIYRDRYVISDEIIEDINSATEFISNSKIVSVEINLRESNGKSAYPWAYGERSLTWKTDCLNCKKRHHEKEILTACEKAQKYCSEILGINISTSSEKTIANIVLPRECICTQQKQRILNLH